MATVYFLGAGASASDGLPVTSDLNYGIAAFLCEAARDRHLAWFYEELYGVEHDELAPARDAWRAYLGDRERRPDAPNPLPPLIETLSILDLALSEGRSLGVSNCREGKELNVEALTIARQELSMALGTAIEEAMANYRTPLVHQLMRTVELDDTLITTNWDTLLDRACTAEQRRKERALSGREEHLKRTNISYGAVAERLVDHMGEDIEPAPEGRRLLLKLHGSLNWFHCPCCGTLYTNVAGPWVIDPQNRRQNFDFCHCNSGLENLIVAPSFVKDYRNSHLQSVWQRAQRALDDADRWVFIGYSLPMDDYHIRALLLRALRANTQRKKKPPVVYLAVDDTDTRAKEQLAAYRSLFRETPIIPVPGRLPGWLAAAPLARG